MMTAFFLIALAVHTGCARVEVQAPKEPIKMDISMRLDVYQHVAKDIDEIESIVSGKSGAQHAFAEFLVTTAYAQSMDPDLESAAYRRRDRKNQIQQLLSQGIAGENKSGLLSVRAAADAQAQALIDQENSDRTAIYRALAKKNGTSVEDVQKIYSERLAQDAPSGSPIENQNGQWSSK